MPALSGDPVVTVEQSGTCHPELQQALLAARMAQLLAALAMCCPGGLQHGTHAVCSHNASWCVGTQGMNVRHWLRCVTGSTVCWAKGMTMMHGVRFVTGSTVPPPAQHSLGLGPPGCC